MKDFSQTYSAFAASDGIVMRTYENFVNEVQYSEAKFLQFSNYDGKYSSRHILYLLIL